MQIYEHTFSRDFTGFTVFYKGFLAVLNEHPFEKEGEMILKTGVRPCNLIYLIFITPATSFEL